jgi:hypothetical protein
MAKKRASLKGRGVEILFGGGPTSAAASAAATPSDEAAPPASELDALNVVADETDEPSMPDIASFALPTLAAEAAASASASDMPQAFESELTAQPSSATITDAAGKVLTFTGALPLPAGTEIDLNQPPTIDRVLPPGALIHWQAWTPQAPTAAPAPLVSFDAPMGGEPEPTPASVEPAPTPSAPAEAPASAVTPQPMIATPQPVVTAPQPMVATPRPISSVSPTIPFAPLPPLSASNEVTVTPVPQPSPIITVAQPTPITPITLTPSPVTPVPSTPSDTLIFSAPPPLAPAFPASSSMSSAPSPPLSANSTIPIQPISTENQSDPISGGPVSNPSGPTPIRPTSVVPPAPFGSQPITPFPPASGGAASAASPVTPIPTSSATTARPVVTPSTTTVVPAGAAVPTPAPSVAPAPAPQAPATLNGLTLADYVRLAMQKSGEEAEKKQALEQTIVDPDTLKEMRQRIFGEIHELYHTSSEKTANSPGVAKYSLDLLQQARMLMLSSNKAGDLARAEYYVEMVRNKLNRTEKPIPDSELGNVRWIGLFQAIILLMSTAFAMLPWLTSPTGVPTFLSQLGFAVPTDPKDPNFIALVNRAGIFLGLLGALGWGGIGGVIGTLYNFPWFVQIREYDPAFNLNYFAGPIKGLIVGGAMFLVLSSGLLGSAPDTSNTAINAGGPEKYMVSFVVAFLSGFKQEYVFELFDNLLKVIFRSPPPIPKGMDPNAVK